MPETHDAMWFTEIVRHRQAPLTRCREGVCVCGGAVQVKHNCSVKNKAAKWNSAQSGVCYRRVQTFLKRYRKQIMSKCYIEPL